MNISSNNYKRFTLFALVLIGISTALAYLIFILFGEWFSAQPTYVQIVLSMPTVPTIYAAFFFLFNRYFWRCGIFKAVGIVVADDLNGTWKGVMKSSHDQLQQEISAELVIEQTATSIKICGKFDQSRSISTHEHFGKGDMYNQTVLHYFFKNDPNYDAVPTMAMHEGSAILIYAKQEDVLSGHYYSGRGRNNYGTIRVKRVSGLTPIHEAAEKEC